MTNYAYNTDIPDGPNNPSADQPKMKTNTNSIKNLIGEDHITFGNNNGGFHKWTRIDNTTLNPPISGMTTTAGGLYTRKVNNNNQLFFADGQAGVEYQLTSTNTSVSRFGTNTNYGSSGGATFYGGWTFLPGQFDFSAPTVDAAVLLEYGFVDTPNSGGTGTVTFPRALNNAAFSVTITAVRNQSNVDTIYVVSVSSSGFTYRNTSSSGITGFYWMAIGV